MTHGTETTSLPIVTFPDEIRPTTISSLYMNLSRAGILKAWDSATKKDAEAAFFAETLGITGREDYLVFRDALKSWLRTMAQAQKVLALRMSQPGGCSTSQTCKMLGAQQVTTLIEIRRAGKAWSASQAEASRKAA